MERAKPEFHGDVNEYIAPDIDAAAVFNAKTSDDCGVFREIFAAIHSMRYKRRSRKAESNAERFRTPKMMRELCNRKSL